MKLLLILIGIFSFFNFSAQYQIGHTTIDFIDASRGGRVIETEVYYPASTAGTDVTIETGEHPVIVFGHGFVMAWDAYANIWEELVPRGYVMAFPRTEGSILGTDHQQFGFDLQFLVTEVQLLNIDVSSPLFGGIASETALMGHSMGGGAAFLAADSLSVNGNQNLKTLIGLAPAESSSNGVSSINSATSVTVKSVVFSGEKDGVTPAADHHTPMYNSLASDCKTFVNILGGAHCYFANSNFSCDFGEGTSSTGISISREQQHSVLFDFVNPWLDFMLKGECTKFNVFNDSLAISSRVTSLQSCNYIPLSISASTTDEVIGNDGTITIIGMNGNPTYEYSIDGINYQSSGSFNNLPDAVYTVYVRDECGCVMTTSVAILESGVTAQNENFLSYNVYPNPVKHILSIKINSNMLSEVKIEITDAMGRVVSNEFKENSPNKFEINMSGVSNGIYFVTVSKDDIRNTVRVIKR